MSCVCSAGDCYDICGFIKSPDMKDINGFCQHIFEKNKDGMIEINKLYNWINKNSYETDTGWLYIDSLKLIQFIKKESEKHDSILM
ncbi:hypothetical protein [Spiroplasma endosymbiont of Nebria brevicollis]|uniref:hypothetical protein n=1 Tax=Spiroplasma endosymbiont of Nebria brevicollis TaxID=3066284 RepID=UPI00313BDC0D